MSKVHPFRCPYICDYEKAERLCFVSAYPQWGFTDLVNAIDNSPQEKCYLLNTLDVYRGPCEACTRELKELKPHWWNLGTRLMVSRNL